MRIVANGEPLDMSEPFTLLQLLHCLKVTPETVVIEHNGNIIPRNSFACTLNEGDRVEILQFLGGG